jgi:hypothetical protein
MGPSASGASWGNAEVNNDQSWWQARTFLVCLLLPFPVSLTYTDVVLHFQQAGEEVLTVSPGTIDP